MIQIFCLLSGLLLTATLFAAKKVDYTAAGNHYEGYLSTATGNAKGLVVIIHDWDGLTDYEVKRSDMLSALGYDAFAVDLYGKGNRPQTTELKRAETKKLYDDRQKMRTLILAGLTAARRHVKGNAVIIGYCFGGTAVLELARYAKAPGIKGYATFHGGLKTPEGQTYSKTAPIFVVHGGADTSVTMADVATLSEQLEKAGITYKMEVYSAAPHAFSVIGSPRYQERADTQSWKSFLAFLAETLP